MYTGYEKVLERLLEERLNVGMEQDEIASIIGHCVDYRCRNSGNI